MKILFLCTHNSCRSILAETLFNHLAPAEMTAHSAGSEPAGAIDPQTLALLQDKGIATDGLFSKSWYDLGQLNPGSTAQAAQRRSA